MIIIKRKPVTVTTDTINRVDTCGVISETSEIECTFDFISEISWCEIQYTGDVISETSGPEIE